MEFNKQVKNPMLNGMIELLKDRDDYEHRNMFLKELTASKLLSPALMDPEPIRNEEGELIPHPGSKVLFPMLVAPNGKRFFMGFTDMKEYELWTKQNKDLPFFALEFPDYVRMILATESEEESMRAMGFVVNPLTSNIIIPKDMISAIMAQRLGLVRPKPAKPETDDETTEE